MCMAKTGSNRLLVSLLARFLDPTAGYSGAAAAARYLEQHIEQDSVRIIRTTIGELRRVRNETVKNLELLMVLSARTTFNSSSIHQIRQTP
uniref:Putative secreted protein n=1 Tax=Anopheles darlingi TaxID=43151 RepID=A0A2M4DFE9_ANODA